MPSPVCIVGATRIVESFTSPLISINVRNQVRAGIRITGLPE
jgi:hypothetical protein